MKSSKDLGRGITRRDFLNGVALGAGGALLSTPAPAGASDDTAAAWPNADWYGYGGVGDYRLSHGNTPEVVVTAHRIRDGEFAALPAGLVSDEDFDLVIVGSGMAGLGAALEFTKLRKPGQTCLLLDNHPVFGGEAKENEFLVGGTRLIAPQGANGFFVPPSVVDPAQAAGDPRYYTELGIPREFDWAEMPPGAKPLRFCDDNYGYLVRGLQDHVSTGHFYSQPDAPGGSWAVDMWAQGLANTPLSDPVRQALLAWYRSGALRKFASDDEARRWLDTMSYREFLERELKMPSACADYADLFLANAGGLGSDATSAWAARNLPMPGLADVPPPSLRRTSFPGGNSGFARYFLKSLIPAAIAGEHRFEDIVTGRLIPEAFDQAAQPVRMRLASTVVSVRHDGEPQSAESVTVTYVQDGRLRAVRAKAVVMGSGAWINRHIVRDLPETHRAAMAQFRHAPFLVANVALTNWRFMHRLGITAAIWSRGEGDFGYTCNIRRPMHVGDYRPPLDPDQPAVLSFYTPFLYPGLPIEQQVMLGRAELFATTYAEYERRILLQMNRLFASSGFDAGRDVAGLILNRWGHALSVPYPGFYGGASGGPGPGDIVRRHYGRIAFGHSELDGLQHWGPAADEGRRAVTQLFG